MKSFQLFFIALFFFSFQMVCAQSPVQMPVFSFTEVFTNKPFTQKDLPKDGIIIFNYYDTGCSHCQKMGEGIAKNINIFKNVKFYFISMNDKEYVEGFINMFAKRLRPNNQVTFIHDPNGQFIELFKPTQTPSIYIYNAKTKKLLKHLDGEDDVKKVQIVLP